MSAALITSEIRERLLQNGRLMRQLAGTPAEPDFLPVVKLFTPDGGCSSGALRRVSEQSFAPRTPNR